MPAPLASNFLAPNASFVVLVLVALVVFALLVVWPLIGRREAARPGASLDRTPRRPVTR